jgi:predicted transposase YdaD
MRRDSIFYSLFNGSPSLLFDLLAEVPDSADRYRFESVAVKEPGGDRDRALGDSSDGADNRQGV